MGELLPYGIHFGLPDDTYHADPALGSTRLKAVFQDPVEFQFERLYGEETDTYAKTWGSAFHARVLEGRAAFDARFKVQPDPKSYGDKLLVTAADLKKFLDDRGVQFKRSSAKEDLVKLVLAADPSAAVWDAILRGFQDELAEGVTAIPTKMAREISLAVSWMSRHPKIAGVLQDGAFFGGAPEVSFFYEQHGVRLKCRFDYVYPGMFIDLKSYRPWKVKETKKNVVKAIRDFRYDQQAAAYRRGYDVAREQFVNGELAVHGAPPTDNFLELLFERDDIKWLWLMVKASGAPTSTLVELPSNLDVVAGAYAEVEDAIITYAQYRDRFGEDKDWEPEPDVLVLDNEDFPPSFGVYA